MRTTAVEKLMNIVEGVWGGWSGLEKKVRRSEGRVGR
jgi:hypothetical protein